MEVEQPIITATHGRAGVATGAAERLRTAAALNGRQDISDVDPGVLNFVISQSKNAGNAAFKRKNYQEAVKLYSQAIAGCDTDTTLYSNRSAALLALGRLDEALWDAQKCVQLGPDWPKGYYRLGAAHMAMSEWSSAGAALKKGLGLAPGNKDMEARLAESQEQLRQLQWQQKAQLDLSVKETVAKLRKVRQADARQKLLNQFKSAMVAPDYDIDDYEWRPTFIPGMKLRRLERQQALGGSPSRAMLANYLNAIADLDGPKRSLPLLDDSARLEAYRRGLQNALKEQPGAHVLALGAGTGILALMSAAEGAGTVTSVERSKAMYSMAKLAIRSNRSVAAASSIRLVDCALKACKIKGEAAELPGDPDAASAGKESTPHGDMGSRADVLVTDLVDSSVLGMGLLDALDYAGEHLLAPGARVIPSKIRVFAAVVELGRVGAARSLDLSPINVYRWYPHQEPLGLSSIPYRLLSEPVEVHALDLQARVDSSIGRGKDSSEEEGPQWEADFVLGMEITHGGVTNGIVSWFELDMLPSGASPGVSLSSAPNQDGAKEPRPWQATSWQQSFQYTDEVEVRGGSTVRVRVRQDAGQIHFSLVDSPATRVRHNLVPRWHYDMVLDQQRNEMYDRAISGAVKRLQQAGRKEISVLDAGAGTGILGMLAARAGATAVVGVEQNPHMADVGEECMVRNGLIGKCIMLSGDVRRLSMGKNKPDGTPPDLSHPIDLVVAEVFDAGLIGEGALHIYASVQANLVAETYTLVPSSATVYCQVIEMRTGCVQGFDLSQLNRYRWRPDYEGHELGGCRSAWRPLTDVKEVFHFNFKNWRENLSPGQEALEFTARADGVCNAVAFWFDLNLDHEHTLSSSPYGEKGATWPQAVQWLQEVRVVEGQDLSLTARHDTYGISFQASDDAIHVDELGSLSPLYDPGWHVQYERVSTVNKQMMKACAQNPLEFRKIAEAAVLLGSRPRDLGVDCEKAVEFCAKIMS